MAKYYKLDTGAPVGTDSPTEGDNEIKLSRDALWERLNKDLWFEKDEGENIVDGDDVGEHRKVTFKEPIADYNSDTTYTYGDVVSHASKLWQWNDTQADHVQTTNEKTPGTDSEWAEVVTASKGALYTKDVSEKARLHYMDEDNNEGQVVNSLDVDDSGVAWDSDNEQLIIPEGSATKGVNYLHLRTGDYAIVDPEDANLEIPDTDGTPTGGVRLIDIATPSEDSDAYPTDICVNTISAWGFYTGSADAQTIDVGFRIRHLVIKGNTTGSGCEAIVVNAETGTAVGWKQDDGDVSSERISFPTGESGHHFTVRADDDDVNNTDETYYWYATGTRS